MKKLLVFAGLAAALFAPLAAQAQVYPGYDRDRAYCASGRSGQSYNTCMRELKAAHFEARRDRMDNRHNRMERERALNRCENLRGPRDRQICKDRVRAGRY